MSQLVNSLPVPNQVSEYTHCKVREMADSAVAKDHRDCRISEPTMKTIRELQELRTNTGNPRV